MNTAIDPFFSAIGLLSATRSVWCCTTLPCRKRKNSHFLNRHDSNSGLIELRRCLSRKSERGKWDGQALEESDCYYLWKAQVSFDRIKGTHCGAFVFLYEIGAGVEPNSTERWFYYLLLVTVKKVKLNYCKLFNQPLILHSVWEIFPLSSVG